jgi:hypothetical protein
MQDLYCIAKRNIAYIDIIRVIVYLLFIRVSKRYLKSCWGFFCLDPPV